MSGRVLIVDRTPHPRLNGVARYMIHLADQFASRPGPPDTRFLCNGLALRPQAWLARHRPPQPGHRWLTPLLSRWQPLAQRASRARLVHYPYHNLPANWQVGRQPLLVTVHGAAAAAEAAWGMTSGRAATIRQRLASAGRRLVHVITVSHWASDEIAREFGLDPRRVTAIHHGVDHEVFHPSPARPPGPPGRPYILHVGPCSRRKNVGTLLEAFARLRRRQRVPHQLLLVGRQDAARREILARSAALGLDDAVIAPGEVDDRRLADLYRGAACFVFPSLYEGFGLPVLEAMACGTPVITSGITALPEIAGGAAHLLTDPRDADALADALERLLEDRRWREQLTRRGLERARGFTWQAAAEQHLDLYRRLL